MRLVLLINPGLLLDGLADYQAIVSNKLAVVTALEHAAPYCQTHRTAELFYLRDETKADEEVWREAAAVLSGLRGLGFNVTATKIFRPWSHEREQDEAELIEILQQVLPDLPEGKAMMEALFSRQLPIFQSPTPAYPAASAGT